MTDSEKKHISSGGYPEVKIKDVFSAFWRGVKPYKKTLFLAIILMVSVNIVSSLVPLFYRQFFDVVSVSGDKTVIAAKLTLIILQILGFNAVIWLFYRVCTFCHISYQTKTIATLKQQAYNYLIDHSYSFFSNNFTGSLTQRVNRFSRAFEVLSDKFIWEVLPLFVRIVSIITIVFFINKWISLVILIWVIVFMSFNIIFSSWKLKYDIKVAEIDSKTTGYLADTLTNQNTIQLFNGQKFESKGYQQVTNNQAKATRTSWNLDAILDAGQSFLSFTIQFLLFYFAIKYWQKDLITVGVFVLLQVYIISLIDQLWGFTRVVKNVYQSYADAKEMVEIMLLPHEIQDKANAKTLIADKGEIEFKNLSFTFNQTRKVLDDINLIIKPGEKVALIGPSGAGKTTFVKLLLRLYSPSSGQILIDGQDISEVTQDSLRKSVSMVPQDPILFHRTLAENIAYGKRGSTLEEIKAAAKSAHCDDFIENLSYKLDTFVGERGIKLSGGERQRVAIARAILRNAPILILDEATSSLDSNSEVLIQDALNSLMIGKTTIIIAHRLSTIQKMDRIIVINEGKIVEQGSHKKLIRTKNSLYKKLWELQAGGFLKSSEEDIVVAEELPEAKDEGKNSNETISNGNAKMINF